MPWTAASWRVSTSSSTSSVTEAARPEESQGGAESFSCVGVQRSRPSRQALEEAEQRSKTLVDLNIDDNDGEASEACGGLWGFRGFVRS